MKNDVDLGELDGLHSPLYYSSICLVAKGVSYAVLLRMELRGAECFKSIIQLEK